MNRYISGIHVNKLYHLQDISIQIADENSPHLILTGKNGSGKTVLLNAIAEFLGKIKNDIDLTFLNYHEWIKSKEDAIKESEKGSPEYIHAKAALTDYQKKYDGLYDKVNVSFCRWIWLY